VPDLTFDKLIFFVFAVAPGFIAIQVYGLMCPGPKKDWGNSLVEVITYSLVNLSVWIWWVQSLVRQPFEQIHKVELTAAFVVVCVLSPVGLSLGWFYLRTRVLHHRLGVDHPTPRGWEHFVRTNHEYWVIFHLKTGKLLGGYFGPQSFAATFPQEPEMYVEEIWRVDDRGEFVEKVPGTLGGVIRVAECERVEFLSVEREGESDGAERRHPEGAAGAGTATGRHPEARQHDSRPGGGAGAAAGDAGPPHHPEGGFGDRSAEAQGVVSVTPYRTFTTPGGEA
jgi:hypothetical protein